ncbi:MAG: hypothetical protein ACRD2A_04990, partial [Vicinamibacterales bacterium]
PDPHDQAVSRQPGDDARPAISPISIDECHRMFRRWLGDAYDLDALNAVLATAAAERLEGDPLWLLVISGSGNAKTELVQSLRGIGAHLTSTISSEGALLSGTPKRQQARNATGGLLREVGERGMLVIKDVTSILSMNRDTRQSVLAAIREIHDGRWTRHLGSDGGRTLEWSGRITIVGAVTTAWDTHHSVIASMGDRFLIVRTDSTVNRLEAGRQAMANTGHEEQMRRELSDAIAGVLARTGDEGEISDAESDLLLAAANLVTRARTAVEFDYRGDVVDAHAPEMPTRFAKQLTQLVHGALLIGLDRDHAMRLAIRCARDSMPPLRLMIVDDVASYPNATVAEIRKRANKPRATIDRQLQALHMLGVIDVAEEPRPQGGTVWRYRLSADIDPAAIHVPDKLDDTLIPSRREINGSDGTNRDTSNISGTSIDPDDPEFDPELYAPDGEPWCRPDGKGGCLNASRCRNLAHRGPRS